MVSLLAPAKINFTLDVLGKRPDGYHDVRMVMQTVSLCDTVQLECGGSGIQLFSDSDCVPADQRNLAYRAAEAFYRYTKLAPSVKIHLEKRIPVSAGLAGGSSDGAAVLLGLNQLYHSPLSVQQLCAIGKTIGADLPFCILGGTALAEGIGEKLTPLPAFPDCSIVLATPPIAVSTPWVYAQMDTATDLCHPDTEAFLRHLEAGNLEGLAALLCNVMESVVCSHHPVISQIKRTLADAGAIGSAMSGSGPSVFGLFSSLSQAERACNKLSEEFRDVYFVRPLPPHSDDERKN